MRKDSEKEVTESGTALAITVALMKILLLTITGGVFWIVWFVVSQQNQFNNFVRGFLPY